MGGNYFEMNFPEELSLERILTTVLSSSKAEKMLSWCPEWSLRRTSNAPPARIKVYITHFALRSWLVRPLDLNILVDHNRQIDVVKDVIGDHSSLLSRHQRH